MKIIIKAEILLLGTVLILKLWIMGLPPEYIFLQNWKKLEAKTKVCYVITNSTQRSGVKFEWHANRNHGEHIVVSNIQRHVLYQENQYQNERPGYDAGILAINHNPVSGPNK